MKTFVEIICCFTVLMVQQVAKPHSISLNRQIEILHNCKCVHYDYCDPYGFIDKEVKNPHHFSLVQQPHCTGGKSWGEYRCCKTKKTNSLPPSAASRKPKVCGVQSTMIASGTFSAPVDGEFPWIAAVYRREGDLLKYHSTGTLIAPKVILTTSHNFYGRSAEYNVILNGNVLLADMNQRVEDKRNVVEIVYHPKYSNRSSKNNIALLILDQPFNFINNDMINTICLPPNKVDLEGETCVVAGWGRPNETHADVLYENYMKKMELPIVNHKSCEKQLRNTRLGAKFSLHPTSICAGGEEGKDACKGDGGSPLMCFLPNEPYRFFVAGLVSWGIGCGTANLPGVYTNILQLKGWILEELSERKLSLA